MKSVFLELFRRSWKGISFIFVEFAREDFLWSSGGYQFIISF